MKYQRKMRWCWWVALATLLLVPCLPAHHLLEPPTPAHLLLDYDSPTLDVLPWGVSTGHRLSPPEVDALLARLVYQTAKELRHRNLKERDFLGNASHDGDNGASRNSRSLSDYLYNGNLRRHEGQNENNISVTNLTQHQTSDFRGLHTKIHQEKVNKKPMSNLPVRWKRTMDRHKIKSTVRSDKKKHKSNRKYESQSNCNNCSHLEDTNIHHKHNWNDENLKRETKKEVYRKLVSQALQHHLQAHQQLLEIVRLRGLKESIVHQWFKFITGPEAALRVLHSLHNHSTSQGNQPRVLHSLHSNINNQQKSLHITQLEIDLANSDSPNKHKTEIIADRIQQTEKKIVPSDTFLEQLEERLVASESQAHEERSYTKTEGLPVQHHINKTTGHKDLLTLLVRTIQQTLHSTNTTDIRRYRRSEGGGGLMYLPVGGTTKVTCPTAADAAGVSISQMAFLTVCLTVFSLVVNISNNINNNNNNNNINSDNNLSNNNAQLSVNVNNAAQVNVMLPPPLPRRKKRTTSMRDTWGQVVLPPRGAHASSLDHILQQVLLEKQLQQQMK